MFKVTYTNSDNESKSGNFVTRKQAEFVYDLAVEDGRIDPKLYRRSKDGKRWLLEKYTEVANYSGTGADLFVTL